MRVLLYTVGRLPKTVDISNELGELQDVVDGYIEVVPFHNTPYLLVCNEEGKLNDLEANRLVPELKAVIYGDFFICKNAGEDFAGLTDEEVKEILESNMIGGMVND